MSKEASTMRKWYFEKKCADCDEIEGDHYDGVSGWYRVCPTDSQLANPTEETSTICGFKIVPNEGTERIPCILEKGHGGNHLHLSDICTCCPFCTVDKLEIQSTAIMDFGKKILKEYYCRVCEGVWYIE